MPTKIAKLWVNHLSMTGDLLKHIAYLTNGHQLDPDEQQPQVWTKSLPKGCKDDHTALVAHWRGIYDRFLTKRATPESIVHHNAKITGRQFVINLPNDISQDQVNQLAKAVLKDFPRHIPVSMVRHQTTNRGKEQGLRWNGTNSATCRKTVLESTPSASGCAIALGDEHDKVRADQAREAFGVGNEITISAATESPSSMVGGLAGAFDNEEFAADADSVLNDCPNNEQVEDQDLPTSGPNIYAVIPATSHTDGVSKNLDCCGNLVTCYVVTLSPKDDVSVIALNKMLAKLYYRGRMIHKRDKLSSHSGVDSLTVGATRQWIG